MSGPVPADRDALRRLVAEPCGRRFLVVGLGRSGTAAARYLLARGARVAATDRRPAGDLGPGVRALGEAGVTLHLGGHPAAPFREAEAIVLSPGVDPSKDRVAAARARGIPVLSEIDLVAEGPGARILAVTGTNGKSTTTALLAAMLGEAGFDAIPCGNYGTPLVEAVEGDHPGRRYALEVSSFQLETTRLLRAGAAVLLGIRPDHLDRHGSLAAYRAAKERVLDLRSPGAPAICCVDDPLVAEACRGARPPVLEVTLEGRPRAGGFLDRGRLVLRVPGRQEEAFLGDDEVPLPGRHNRWNVLAAALAAAAAGADGTAIGRAVRRFRSLPHRLEEVAQVRGVLFVDDSKATNVDAALRAIEAFPGRRLHVLLGGRDKDGDFRPLAPALAAAGARAITWGEAGPRIADVLEGEGFGEVDRCGDIAEATRQAFSRAAPGDVVLLAPACASFDAFRSYAHRGEAFAALARELARGEEQR